MTPEAAELAALRLVSQGAITIAYGGYVRNNCPIAGELAEALVRLHTAGHLTVGAPGKGGHRPVQTTPAGVARLAELGGRAGST